MSPFSRILFPRPSFLEGVARIFDFGGALSTYNISRSPSEADAHAIQADWEAVGDDLWAGLEQAEAEYLVQKQALDHESKVPA